MFTHNNHVMTKMGKLPPSPCHCCSSENHWDKECPDYDVYRVRTSMKPKNAHNTEKETDEGDKLYQSTYGILLSQQVAASQFDFSWIQSDFDLAVHEDEASTFITGRIESEHKTGEQCKASVEEIEDESVVAAHIKKKLSKHLIHESEDHEEEKPQRSKHSTQSQAPEGQESYKGVKDETQIGHHAQSKSDDDVQVDKLNIELVDHLEPIDEEISFASSFNVMKETKKQTVPKNIPLPPPPKEFKPVRMMRKQFYPTGESSVGVLVLAVKGWVGNLNNTQINLRLDSCADVTLILLEYYDTLKDAPAIQQGMWMKLWQLTDKDSTLCGFVRIPIFIMSDKGIVLELEAEAYVVPGMTVLILLGEDYQLTYKIGVSRNVKEGPKVHFGRSEWELQAQQVDRTKDFERM